MSGYENKLSLYEGTEKTIMVGKHCVTNTCTFQMICRQNLEPHSGPYFDPITSLFLAKTKKYISIYIYFSSYLQAMYLSYKILST